MGTNAYGFHESMNDFADEKQAVGCHLEFCGRHGDAKLQLVDAVVGDGLQGGDAVVLRDVDDRTGETECATIAPIVVMLHDVKGASIRKHINDQGK
jgi:hypothetical protein